MKDFIAGLLCWPRPVDELARITKLSASSIEDLLGSDPMFFKGLNGKWGVRKTK